MSLSIKDIINIINNYTNYLFYIGQTDNPERRLREHFKHKKVVLLIPLYKDNKSVIDVYEQQLIKEFSNNKNNMNLMVNNIPKSMNNENNNNNNNNEDNEMKNQYVYIAFKDYNVLNDLDEDLKEKVLILYKSSNKNIIINYEKYIMNINNNKEINKDNNKKNKKENKKEIKQQIINEKEYQEILETCINKINPYLNQKIGKFQYFHIGKCKNYNERKNQLISKGFDNNNIKQIKKCLKNDKVINSLKYDLCENYKNKSDIKLDNKNGLFSNLFKNWNNNYILYIYFY